MTLVTCKKFLFLDIQVKRETRSPGESRHSPNKTTNDLNDATSNSSDTIPSEYGRQGKLE